MSVRIERPEAAALVGGALVMLGACLPWLNLFAGTQQYSGLIGAHGQVLFAGGALAIVASAGIRRSGPRRMRWVTLLLGLTLLGFNLWLMTGLIGTSRQDAAARFVPQTSPGLLVSTLGIAFLILGPVAGLVRGDGHKDRI